MIALAFLLGWLWYRADRWLNPPEYAYYYDGKIIWYVEVKPWYRDSVKNRKPPLNDNQCQWFWKFFPQFCATIRYVIATDTEDLLDRVAKISVDISVPDRYFHQLNAYKEASDANN